MPWSVRVFNATLRATKRNTCGGAQRLTYCETFVVNAITEKIPRSKIPAYLPNPEYHFHASETQPHGRPELLTQFLALLKGSFESVAG